jgi:hypothetical protein
MYVNRHTAAQQTNPKPITVPEPEGTPYVMTWRNKRSNQGEMTIYRDVIKCSSFKEARALFAEFKAKKYIAFAVLLSDQSVIACHGDTGVMVRWSEIQGGYPPLKPEKIYH